MSRVIIIEDEILVAAGIEDIITNNGYEVVGKATNYLSAKKLIYTERYDLILCDINLNDKHTGIDLMRETKDKINAPFIFITAFSDKATIEKANKVEPVNYITKPFNKKQLLVSIERAITTNKKSSVDLLPTDVEIKILKLLSKGLNSKEIAKALSKSQFTIDTQRRNMINRFNVKNVTEMICLATSKKWITYSDE